MIVLKFPEKPKDENAIEGIWIMSNDSGKIIGWPIELGCPDSFGGLRPFAP
jgi:hypothetical protein